MYKKVINYIDYDGNPRSEAFYFNLTKAEMVKMELRAGGMQEMLQRIIEAEDSYRVAEVVEDIITKAYGEKSADGKRFIKSQEIVDSFKATDAYSELFMMLLRDNEEATAFIRGILPQDLREEIAKKDEEEAKLAKGASEASN